MIFVSLGTQAMDFSRCLKMLDEMIEYHDIREEVVVQLGNSKYESSHFKVLPFLPEEEYRSYIEQASVIISHAGSGALFNSLSKGKCVIAVARLKKYHEMINDHQTELTRKLSEEGYIIDGTYSLIEAWEKKKSFKPRKLDIKNTIPQKLEELINMWLK